MDHRFKLFENICFPSITNQKNQNFEWLVFFDFDTKEKYREKIIEYEKKYKKFKPIFIKESKSFKERFRQEIINSTSPEIEYIITTRIDNDDAIHYNAIEKIQQNFKNQDLFIIDFPKGICFQIEPSIKLSKVSIKDTHFISLVEKISDFITVLAHPHNKWPNTINRVLITEEHYWLETIHKFNLINTFKAIEHISNNRVLDQFGINKEFYKPSFIYVGIVLLKRLKSKLKMIFFYR